MPQLSGPLINGHLYDFSSIEVNVGGLMLSGVSSLNYRHGLEPGEFRGTKPQKLGRTRGQYSAGGSFTMVKSDYNILTAKLALQGAAQKKGYMETAFIITAIYQELPTTPPTTDVLVGCRITDESNSHSAGSDALVVEVTIDIMRITSDGKVAVFDNTGTP